MSPLPDGAETGTGTPAVCYCCGNQIGISGVGPKGGLVEIRLGVVKPTHCDLGSCVKVDLPVCLIFLGDKLPSGLVGDLLPITLWAPPPSITFFCEFLLGIEYRQLLPCCPTAKRLVFS